ncbi:MAG TPA: hypothetical protein G4O02_13135 [Caldilineae bacterium]|nr:hypothetical protein [Caldilineae bacterium]
MRNERESGKGRIEHKVGIISLDGATWDVLLPWIREGHLPHLAKLLDEGVWGTLRSTIPPVTAPAWASFQLGKSPGKHGLFHFTHYQPGSYDMVTINATHIPTPTLWQLVSQAGRRVCIINVPVTYPPQPINGYVVSGMLSPRPEVAFWPPELWEEVKREIGDYQILGMIRRFDYLGIKGFVPMMMEIAKKRAQLAHFLLAKEDWDLFMIHFQDTDTLQHAAWAWIDPAHPDFASKPAKERELVLDFYRLIDTFIGELVDALGAHRDVIVMSDHGFGPVLRRVYINQWLQNEGYLTSHHQSSWKGRLIDWAETVVRRVDVLKLRRRLIKPRSRMEDFVERLTSTELIIWPKTRAYAPAGPFYGRIYLNTVGREPMGTVARGPAWDALREEIRDKLLKWVDPETGQQVIRQVWLREELYHGPRAELLPDLVVVPADGYQIATNFRHGILVEDMPRFLTGTHRLDGIVALKGPAFAPRQEPIQARIEDLAPTILYLLGLSIPDDMDGEVLVDALDPGLLAQRPIERIAADAIAAAGDEVFSEEDLKEITTRLTDLGYLQ